MPKPTPTPALTAISKKPKKKRKHITMEDLGLSDSEQQEVLSGARHLFGDRGNQARR